MLRGDESAQIAEHRGARFGSRSSELVRRVPSALGDRQGRERPHCFARHPISGPAPCTPSAAAISSAPLGLATTERIACREKARDRPSDPSAARNLNACSSTVRSQRALDIANRSRNQELHAEATRLAATKRQRSSAHSTAQRLSTRAPRSRDWPPSRCRSSSNVWPR